MTIVSDREYKTALKDGFGFSDFKNDEQKYAVECIVSESYKNIIISMASQAGKSLCYQLPRSFQRSGVVLVISPNIALIANKVAYLIDLRIPATSITSVTPTIVRRDIIREFEDYENNPYQFLYLTPEMIMNGSDSIRGLLDCLLEDREICQIVVDQAHLVMDVGFDFRCAYSKLKFIRQKYPNIPWVALTTASKSLMSEIASALSMSDPKFIKGPSHRNNIYYDVKISGNFKINDMIKDIIELDDIPEKHVTKKTYASGVLFCSTNGDAEKFSMELCEAGITSKSFYGSKKDVNKILKEWKDGIFPVLVATEQSFNSGVRRAPLQYVVHLSPTKNFRTFYQQSGLIDVERGYSRMISSSNTHTDKLMSDYISHRGCRRAFISDHFGDKDIQPCGNSCDNCERIKNWKT